MSARVGSIRGRLAQRTTATLNHAGSAIDNAFAVGFLVMAFVFAVSAEYFDRQERELLAPRTKYPVPAEGQPQKRSLQIAEVR